MKVTRDVASQRLAEYMKTVVLPGLKGGKKDNAARFKIGFGLGMGLIRITDEQYENLKELGAVDGDGAIDVDVVRKGAVEGVATAGGEVFVEKLGIWLSSDDVAKLLSYIETGVLGQN